MDDTDTNSVLNERICWICFSNQRETPANVKWVSPCKCSGGTQWTHEPCLLTWIIRKQGERFADGDIAPIIVRENLDPRNPDAAARWLQTRREAIEDFDEKLIKCPQCNYPYEVTLAKRGFFVGVFMDAQNLCTQLSNMAVPYIAIASGLYVVMVATTAFGLHSIETVCGADDYLTMHLKTKPWRFVEASEVFSVPFWLISIRSGLFQREMALSASAFLLSRFIFPPPKLNILPRPGTPLWLTSIVLNYNSMFSSVVYRRRTVLFGILVLKYAYSLFYRRFLTPWILGQVSKEPAISHSGTALSSFDEQFAAFETVGLVEDQPVPQEQITLSVFSLAKQFVGILLFPTVSAFCGHVLKAAAMRALPSLGKLVGDGDVYRKLVKPIYGLSQFSWSVIGGLFITFSTDLSWLVYNRQRRIQRRKMHIVNFYPEAEAS